MLLSAVALVVSVSLPADCARRLPGPADAALLRAALAAEPGDCEPAYWLALGRELAGQARYGEARLALGAADALGPDDDPGVALELAWAQALDHAFGEALLSLGRAGRRATDPPTGERARRLASLVARIGGVATADPRLLYRPDPGFRIDLTRLADRPRGLAAGDRAVVAFGRRALGPVVLDPAEAIPHPGDEREIVAVAASPGGLALLHRRGQVALPGGRLLQLSTADGGPLDADALAVGPDHRLYLLDRGELHRFEADGAGHVVLPGPDDVRALAIDQRGELHLLRARPERLQIASADGQPRVTVPARSPAGDWSGSDTLAVDRLGGSYLLDRGRGRILRFDPDGAPLAALSDAAAGPGAIARARALAVDGAGDIYLLLDERSVVRLR